MELKLANKLKDIVKRHQVSVAQHSCTQGCSALSETPAGVTGHRAAAPGMDFILPWRLNPGCALKANLDLLSDGSG